MPASPRGSHASRRSRRQLPRRRDAAPTGQHPAGDHFDAGTLCLQFIATEASLAGWAHAHLGVEHLAPERDQEQRDAATLRAAMARVALRLALGEEPSIGDVARLNRLAAGPDLPPQVGPGGRRAWSEPVTVGQLIATVARDAVQLVTAGRHERVRACEAEDCDRVFLDTSRPGSRRWCSMASCGNRAKVRAFRARS